MSVWEQLPKEIRQKGDKLRGNAETQEVIDYLVQQIAVHRKLPAFPVSKGSTSVEGEKYPVSQILPSRRQVLLVVNKKKWCTLATNDQSVVSQGDFSDYNVFLYLPVPKRGPKQQCHMVLAKLGGSMPFVVFSITGDASGAVSQLKKFTKYSAVDLEANNRAVVAYVGAREGFLYFLDDFLFYGFRKPLMLVMLAEIESVSFTMVTSRTFNVVVKLLDDTQHEFEKIDHKYYDMILQFIELHNLNDESMAEDRKAKRQRTEPTVLETAEQEAKEEADNKEDDDDDDDDEEFDSMVESAEESEEDHV